MPGPRATDRDIRFILDELLLVDRLSDLPQLGHATPQAMAEALATTARECAAIAPDFGDHRGGVAGRASETGLAEAWRAAVACGLPGAGGERESGGDGLPYLIAAARSELLAARSPGGALLATGTAAVARTIALHATPQLRSIYLPPLLAGRWLGVHGRDGMAATVQADGVNGYRIAGQVPIPGAGHDLADTTVYLVPARLPGAPPNDEGLSLFVVPGTRIEADGGLGAANGVRAIGHDSGSDMGGFGTPVVAFEDALGTMIGPAAGAREPLATLERYRRLGLATTAVGLAESANRNAFADAGDSCDARPELARIAVIVRTHIEGLRSFGCWIALNVDMARHHTDHRQRQASADLVTLMAPVLKVFATSTARRVAVLARDACEASEPDRSRRAEAILREALALDGLEPANMAEALLFTRAHARDACGGLLRNFFQPVDTFLVIGRSDQRMADITAPFAEAFAGLQQAALSLARADRDGDVARRVAAADYLRLFGLVAVGYLWTQMALVALDRLDDDPPDGAFYTAKVAAARFFMHHLLPQATALASRIGAGPEVVLAFDPRLLGADDDGRGGQI